MLTDSFKIKISIRNTRCMMLFLKQNIFFLLLFHLKNEIHNQIKLNQSLQYLS